MSMLSLTIRERQALERQLHATLDARVYRRTLALLEVAQGRVVGEVARELRVGRRSVQRWLAGYRETRQAQCLADQPGRGRPALLTAADLAVLAACLDHPPWQWGYLARGWTVPLLQAHLAAQSGSVCSGDTLRRGLQHVEGIWKRPRYVLAPDPEKEKKTPHPDAAQARRAPHPRAL